MAIMVIMEESRSDRFPAMSPTHVSHPDRSSPRAPRSSARGRPSVTSHSAIEQVAFELFAERGFEATTLSDIAEASGIAPRTLTRYYRSKNDIPWGQFDRTLAHFEELLADTPTNLPLWARVHRGVVLFNRFPDDAQPSHRERMRLILRTPALQAHSVPQYAHWREVIARFVATETGSAPGDRLPQLVGHVSLALAMTAYDQWLDHPDSSADGSHPMVGLLDLLEESMTDLRSYLSPQPDGVQR